MTGTDPYEILGVSREATPDEIKSAYRRMARKHHPDVNRDDPNAEERFKEIGQAYAVLSDPEKRAHYDRFGTMEGADQPFAGGDVRFGDLFDMFFGGATRTSSTGPVEGDDIRVEATLKLEDVLEGVERTIEYRRYASCKVCDGSGAEGGSKPTRCSTCQGTGMVSAIRNTFIGSVRTTTTCTKCGGHGTFIENPCSACRGHGLQEERTSTTIRIPPGVESGQTMHVGGHGHDGPRGGPPGDLYVVLRVQDHPRFERRGKDLATHLELSMVQAALGDQVEFEGLDSTLELEVPPGTQNGDVFTVRGAGLPPLHGGPRGVLRLRASVRIPKNLNDEQRRILIEFAKASGEEAPKHESLGGLLGGLFKKKK